MMVSHVDDDHVRGILDLTREMVEAQQARRPPALQILSLWHNTFDDVVGNTPAELTAALGSTPFGAASKGGELPADADLEDARFDDDVERAVMVDTLKVLAGIEQGHRLRDDARRLGVPTNPHFGGKLIIARKGGPVVDIGRGLTFTVIGPQKAELTELQEKHDEWLAQQKAKRKPATAALAAYVDRSVPNLSSVVVLAAARGKRMLLTGDARGDKILAGLELAGALKKNAKLHVDVLKVPHHGSANNLEESFFERVTADHYVFSGDGEHGNPERESLEMLLAARGKADYAIHLTYPIVEIDAGREKDWAKAQAREKKRKARKVRPNWSPAKHGLAALIKATRGLAARIEVVPGTGRHLIDLEDPVPF
jgi:hypothetical protein